MNVSRSSAPRALRRTVHRLREGGLLLSRPAWTALMGVLVVLGYYVVPLRVDSSLPVRAALVAVVLVGLAVATTRELRRTNDPVSRLVALLMLVIVCFASAFYALARSGPGQFTGIDTRTDALYFTVVTMATIGYGDIHPVGQAARVLVLLSIAFNVVFVAALASAIATRLRNRLTVEPEAKHEHHLRAEPTPRQPDHE